MNEADTIKRLGELLDHKDQQIKALSQRVDELHSKTDITALSKLLRTQGAAIVYFRGEAQKPAFIQFLNENNASSSYWLDGGKIISDSDRIKFLDALK